MPNSSLNIDISKLGFDPDVLREKYKQERDKRLRTDGNMQYLVPSETDFKFYIDDPYIEEEIKRSPVFEEVDALVIGAGLGGMLASAELRKAGVKSVKIIEKAGDFGGTWYWNRYPGLRCDIQSYLYLPLLEEVGYMPKEKYSTGPEIFEYCKMFARHFDLYKDALFQTNVREIRWDETAKRWIVSTDRGDRIAARFVSISAGPLGRPKLPNVPGIDKFKGHTFHTSRWDYKYTGGDTDGNLTNLKDKRVAFVGTGATAIQCVPMLAKYAKELYVFQRTPSSVDTRDNGPTDQEWAASLTPGWQDEMMQNFEDMTSGRPVTQNLVGDNLSKYTTSDIFEFIGSLGLDKPFPELDPMDQLYIFELADFHIMERIRKLTEDIVDDPETAENLKAYYRQMCKRPCFSDEYLQAFNNPNTHLVDTHGKGVTGFTENEVLVGDEKYEVDCVIFGTGFNTEKNYARKEMYPVFGKGGVSLKDKWKNGPRTLYGIQTSGFPNLMMMGINQTGFTPNLTFSLKEQAKHVAYIVKTAFENDYVTLEVSTQAEDEWYHVMRDKRAFSPLVPLIESCTPGYYNAEGQLDQKGDEGIFGGTYGGGSSEFYDLLREWRQNGELKGIIAEKGEVGTVGASI